MRNSGFHIKVLLQKFVILLHFLVFHQLPWKIFSILEDAQKLLYFLVFL